MLPDLKYTEKHEWLKLEGEHATVGITDFAQQSLGDVTFLELPQVGASLNKGDAFGVVESVKSASDLYMPIGGEVLAVNSDLESDPGAVNTSPYEAGWLLKIKPDNTDEVNTLLDKQAYQGLIDGQ